MVQRGETYSVWGRGGLVLALPTWAPCFGSSGGVCERRVHALKDKGLGAWGSAWPWVVLRGQGEGAGGTELGTPGTPVPALQRGGRLPRAGRAVSSPGFAGAGSGHGCSRKPPQMAGEPGCVPVRPNPRTLTSAFRVISALFF